ncbi:hypothetical protein AA958_12250 [Streptomyces sp. CNQ-509]|uniref:hypothetical protein n=1 Tax=Streptomyces sp. CNQ-509 TaxID=444103 RepID=UPI00062E0C10|nr:hypothetical protein [Streptomyces sp. CNQ-509]AKH82878.1 hypothetical protein AA958_12250 [Streptomyces sp. CNQ-509]
MEENKGLKVTPVNAAAMDPAALPGLVPSPPDEKEKEQDEAETTDEKTESEDSAAAADTEDAADDDSDEDEADKAGSAGKDAEGDADDADEDKATASGDSEAGASDDPGSDGDGPVFEAADRRGSVTIDSTGVRFQLDDTEAEFTWPEIGAVEYKTSRFGRRLVLSVHDDRGICPAEVEAPDKATLKTWAADLESALDAYFEETSP